MLYLTVDWICILLMISDFVLEGPQEPQNRKKQKQQIIWHRSCIWNNKKTSNQIEKKKKKEWFFLSLPFTGKDMQKANKHMKRYSTYVQKKVNIVHRTAIFWKSCLHDWSLAGSWELGFWEDSNQQLRNGSLCLFEQTAFLLEVWIWVLARQGVPLWPVLKENPGHWAFHVIL